MFCKNLEDTLLLSVSQDFFLIYFLRFSEYPLSMSSFVQITYRAMPGTNRCMRIFV